MNDRLDLHKLFKSFVSSDGLKPALLGVCYDKDNNKLVATDGHKLFSLHSASEHITIVFEKDPGYSRFKGEKVILPVEIFEEFEKRTKGFKNNDYRLDSCRLLITGAGTTDNPFFVEYQYRKQEEGDFKTFAGAECINENYPDYQSVIPEFKDFQPIEAVSINPHYLNQMFLAVKSYRPKAAPIVTMYFHSEIAPICVKFFADHEEVQDLRYDCILMPVRMV